MYVFTDGAVTGNNKNNPNRKGGIGVWSEKDSFSGKVEKPTNNICELLAIKKALEMFPEKITIVTDSEYCIKSLTVWIKIWKKNGWITSSKKPVLNKELLQEIDELIQIKKPKFKHIKSHMKEPDDFESEEYKLWYGNMKADSLANQGKFL